MLAPPLVAAQNRIPFDVAALVRETQKQSTDPNRPLFVQWMPIELWTEDASIAQELRSQIESALAPYVLIVIGQPGAILLPETPAYSERELAELTRLVDANGNRYAPVPDAKLPEDARPLIMALRPRLAQMLGGGALKIDLLTFPNNRSGDGRVFPRARAAGAYSVRIGTQEFSWTVPLRALTTACTP